MKVGDIVKYVGENSMVLDINHGDTGKVMHVVSFADDVSVHFCKWDRQGGSQHMGGVSTHHVNGIECFYIEVSELEHAPVPCMFGDEHA